MLIVRIILIGVLIALIAIGGVMLWQRYVVIDTSAVIEHAYSGLFEEYGLDEKALIKSRSDERTSGSKRYNHLFKEYSVPQEFPFSRFEKALRERSIRSRLAISSVDHVSSHDIDSWFFMVASGAEDVFTLRLDRKRRDPAKSYARVRQPKVAIVIDDVGYNISNIEAIFSLTEPVTLAVLPDEAYSSRVCFLARSRGIELILHCPMEAKSGAVAEVPGTLRVSMAEDEARGLLLKHIAGLPGIKGVSNHTGSRATEDTRLMETVLETLKKEHLFFFDSLTSKSSVCRTVARDIRVPYARRDFFLDNKDDPAYIRRQMQALKTFALKNGRAIAICHDRRNTISVLSEMMPALAKENIKFVKLSEMVR